MLGDFNLVGVTQRLFRGSMFMTASRRRSGNHVSSGLSKFKDGWLSVQQRSLKTLPVRLVGR